MKKIIVIYVVLIIAVLLLASIRSGWNFNEIFSFNKATAEIGNKKFNLIIAKKDKDRITGLSGRKSLDENTGMLFVFDKKDKYAFWMKNMNFPIDIIYINDNKIVDVIPNAQAPKDKNAPLFIYKPRDISNYVLEVNAGVSQKNNFKVGDGVKLQNVK